MQILSSIHSLIKKNKMKLLITITHFAKKYLILLKSEFFLFIFLFLPTFSIALDQKPLK